MFSPLTDLNFIIESHEMGILLFSSPENGSPLLPVCLQLWRSPSPAWPCPSGADPFCMSWAQATEGTRRGLKGGRKEQPLPLCPGEFFQRELQLHPQEAGGAPHLCQLTPVHFVLPPSPGLAAL